jgi:hypothetical protein
VQTCSTINYDHIYFGRSILEAIGKLSSNSLGIFKSVAKPLAEPAGIIPKLHLHFPMIQPDFMVPSPPATMTLSGFNVSYSTLILAMSSIPVVVYNAKFNPSLSAKVKLLQ